MSTLRRISYSRSGLTYSDDIHMDLSHLKEITKVQLTECLINGNTGPYCSSNIDANSLKRLINEIDQFEQCISYKTKGFFNDEVEALTLVYHFVENDVSRYNISLSYCNDINKDIEAGNFKLSDLITAPLLEIKQFKELIQLPIDKFSLFKGEPIFDHPIQNNLYLRQADFIYCFPLTKLLKKRIQELELQIYIGEFTYEINIANDRIDFEFGSEKNTGRHWYTTTHYKGFVDLNNLNVVLDEKGTSTYKF